MNEAEYLMKNYVSYEDYEYLMKIEEGVFLRRITPSEDSIILHMIQGVH